MVTIDKLIILPLLQESGKKEDNENPETDFICGTWTHMWQKCLLLMQHATETAKMRGAGFSTFAQHPYLYSVKNSFNTRIK